MKGRASTRRGYSRARVCVCVTNVCTPPHLHCQLRGRVVAAYALASSLGTYVCSVLVDWALQAAPATGYHLNESVSAWRLEWMVGCFPPLVLWTMASRPLMGRETGREGERERDGEGRGGD